MDKPILCLDFDGVIHRYSKGWQDGTIYDSITDGFLEWAIAAGKHFKLVIYSSRSVAPSGVREMAVWLANQAKPEGWQATDFFVDENSRLRLLQARRAEILTFYFASVKPPAFLTIDSRAVTFRGSWASPTLNPEAMLEFKPWMQLTS